MIELPLVSMGLIQTMVQNIAIIAMLVLLYIVIPDTLLSRSKLFFSMGVGIVFGLAVTISIPVLWGDVDAPVIGFNILLIPLAGFTGGPVSAIIVAVALLLGIGASDGALSYPDLLTIVSGVLLGTLVYYARSWNRFPKSTFVQLLILATGMSFIHLLTMSAFALLEGPSSVQADALRIQSVLPYMTVVFLGTLFLGSLIGFIDRKKQAERELISQMDRLEGVVKERTAEIRQANSLQEATIESTADGIVVTDTTGVIQAYNQKASHILNIPRRLPGELKEGRTFTATTVTLLSDPEGFLQLITPLPDSSEQIITSNLSFRNGRIYELYVQPQRIDNRTVGRVYSFHDVTEQRHADDAVRAANRKLVLLANITRHDILNQMTALSGYLELVQQKIHDPGLSGYLDTMKKTVEIIRLQVEFTRDYQDLGLQKPVWQNLKNAFLRSAESFTDRKIVFRCDTGNIEIYADPLIERVFYNLIDNSIRHGELISEIWLSTGSTDPDLLIIYEDNGSGVLPEEKEKIFLKGFGKHTGLGMFLIREILSITGITIRENGVYGQGVRFEIRIPPGKFRFAA